MADTSCVFCKKTDSKFLYSTSDIFGDTYNIHHCNFCKAHFLSPLPSSEQMERAYDESYYGEGEEKFKEGLIEKVLNYFRKQRACLVAGLIGNKGKVLDIGCGNGRFLQYVKEKGEIDIYGIEMEGGSANRAEKVAGIKLKKGILEKSDFSPETFDAVTLFHVFEHLTYPSGYLDIITTILKPGGVAVFSFPNINSFQAKLFRGKWLHLDPPRHLFFFSPEDFINIMNKYGFDLIKEKHFNPEYNPFGFQQSLLNCIYKKRELLYESLKGNKAYTKEYSKINLWLQNLFFKISAPLFVLSDVFESMARKGATVEFVFKKRA
jgi:SAM-dependent methyltransferase